MSINLFGWKDLRMQVTTENTGTGAPAAAAFGPTGNIKQVSFGIGDSVYLAGHVDHDIKPGSTAYMHVHWSINSTSVQPVKWQLSYVTAPGHNQGNFGADTVITLQEAGPGSAWRHMVTEDPVGFTIPEVDSLIILELKRITNGGIDNPNTIFGLFVDVHYEVGQYATPNRLPNFYT